MTSLLHRLLLLFALLALVPAVYGQQSDPVSREVTFTGADKVTLKGTLLLPGRRGTFPAVLLLPGSGPPDRDGNILPMLRTDVLKQIAERLAREGIASLRFDKRSARTYATIWPRDPAKLNHFFRYAAFIQDVRGADAFLRRQPQIAARQVGMVGHSEGGLFTLQIVHDTAGKADAPKAIVLLATAGRPLDVVLLEQLKATLPRQIPDAKSVQEYLDYSARAIAQIKTDKTLPPNAPPGLAGLFNPTVLDLLHAYCTIDPATLAKRYAGPALVLQGEADTQVSAVRDAPRLQSALAGRTQGSVEMMIVPKTSHNLKTVSADSPLGFTGPIVPAALDKIAAFLKKQLTSRPANH